MDLRLESDDQETIDKAGLEGGIGDGRDDDNAIDVGRDDLSMFFTFDLGLYDDGLAFEDSFDGGFVIGNGGQFHVIANSDGRDVMSAVLQSSPHNGVDEVISDEDPGALAVKADYSSNGGGIGHDDKDLAGLLCDIGGNIM